MDDVLSAVDAHTAHAIMENCFQGDILKGRTVLLVSHHTALVSPAATYIVALENVSRSVRDSLTAGRHQVQWSPI
jgi:ABC-type nitrate/sulfonate/bicarbonate transport system ATPase subunit